MNLLRFVITATLSVCLPGIALAQQPDAKPVKEQIERVLTEQAKAWNAGDVEHFMDGYAKIPGLRFASGGTVTRGWQETLARYKQRYPDRAAMGTLSFSELETTILAPDAAVVFGHWRLQTDKREPNGMFSLFTLIFRHTEAGWRIVADHTSAAPPIGITNYQDQRKTNIVVPLMYYTHFFLAGL